MCFPLRAPRLFRKIRVAKVTTIAPSNHAFKSTVQVNSDVSVRSQITFNLQSFMVIDIRGTVEYLIRYTGDERAV